MHLVIGTGQPRDMDFSIVRGRDEIPAGGQIYAIFSGEHASGELDEHLFNAMTDEEFYTFRALAQDAREREARLQQAKSVGFARLLLQRLRGWLRGQQVAASSSASSLNRSNGTATPESGSAMRSA